MRNEPIIHENLAFSVENVHCSIVANYAQLRHKTSPESLENMFIPISVFKSVGKVPSHNFIAFPKEKLLFQSIILNYA